MLQWSEKFSFLVLVTFGNRKMSMKKIQNVEYTVYSNFWETNYYDRKTYDVQQQNKNEGKAKR